MSKVKEYIKLLAHCTYIFCICLLLSVSLLAQTTETGSELTNAITEAVDQAFEKIPDSVRIAVIHMQTNNNEVNIFY